jgi:ligand-binding sensor domain-containing protein/DNA-binding CsgD family transcriptional regulator
MIKKFSQTIIWGFFALAVIAQNQQIDFEYLRIEDGLPHSTINDILQDSLGYLWIATDHGLAFYDNYHIRAFKNNSNDANSLSCNQTYALHLGDENNLWIGTKQSLERYNLKTGVFKHIYFLNPPENEKVPVVEIYKFNDSILLLGTDGGGVRHLNTNSLEQNYLLPEHIRANLSDRISSIQMDKTGRYWLGSMDNGFFIYDPKPNPNQQKVECCTQLLHGIQIRKLMQLSDNEFAVATYGKGILVINTETLEQKPLLSNLKDQKLLMHTFDIVKKGDVFFIGTDGEGLIEYDVNANTILNYKNHGTNTKSLSNNVIRTIFFDKENNLWLGHYEGGVSFNQSKNQFKNLVYSPYSNFSLSHTNVRAILVDSKNRTWIGTDGGGLNVIKDGQIYNKIKKNTSEIFSGSNPMKILSLFEDNHANIWIGTYLNGVYIYNNLSGKLESFNKIFATEVLVNSDVRCITQDRSGKIWIGTNGEGLYTCKPENFEIEHFKRNSAKPRKSLTLDWIHCIVEDQLGFIWIGTAYGVNVYDPVNGVFRSYLHDKQDSTSISGDFIYSIYEDQKHNIWIGTDYGLNRYNRKSDSFISYNVADGLPSNIINSILEDASGKLWLSTINGISNFTPEENKFVNYNTTDGIASNSFTIGASFKHENMLYFGSIAGITYFKPEEITSIDYKIPVVLSELKIFNQKIKTGKVFNKRVILNNSIAYTKGIELFKKENVITIDFTALSYAYADKIVYEYRLLGFSDTWNTVKNIPSLTYTNLASGLYEFQVRVKNIGVYQPITSLVIRVLPPIYEKWWFKFILILFVSSLLFVLLHLKLKNIKNQRDILEQKYEIEKLASEKERRGFNTKINEREKRFRQDEINYKNSQLISTTLLLTQKNKRMTQLKNKIAVLLKEAKNPDVKENLIKIVENIDDEFKIEKDWARFEQHFNEVHKDFIARLKVNNPDLSLTYLRLCACLKLDLSTKDIAALMNISSRGVEKSRSRLRKKFELDAQENLVQFIAKI